MDVLFFVGLALLVGFLGSKVSHRIKFPAVVGYLIGGLILGPSFLNIFNLNLLNNLGVFNDIALALVAFVIGSELHLSTLKKMGRSIITIIFSESFGAFLLVGLGVYLLTGKLYIALIFGAMAPASAPAGTAVVLQEYKAKGPLTNALYAVVGLDDGLAIIIYAFAASLAKISLTGQSFSLLGLLGGPFVEIVGAISLGGIAGVTFGYLAKRLRKEAELLTVSLGVIFIVTGVAKYFHFSLILTNLVLGMFFSNIFLFLSRRTVDALNRISVPIYVIFFVIAGAHLQLRLLSAMGILGVVYIVCRTLGLVGGSFLGATISRAESVIRKYLGLGILSQAGVAIGLAILVTREFSSLGEVGKNLSLLVINTIAATTIIFEILGPIGTKIAITKAGEVRRG
ncbi:MAG: cation:proton antiporter [Candidatus Omnitrophica bacterium]|nr:cation:proton antiporter [Candidatus Omnitrophota bacterium]